MVCVLQHKRAHVCTCVPLSECVAAGCARLCGCACAFPYPPAAVDLLDDDDRRRADDGAINTVVFVIFIIIIIIINIIIFDIYYLFYREIRRGRRTNGSRGVGRHPANRSLVYPFGNSGAREDPVDGPIRAQRFAASPASRPSPKRLMLAPHRTRAVRRPASSPTRTAADPRRYYSRTAAAAYCTHDV